MESFPRPQIEKVKEAAILIDGQIFTGPVHAVARNTARATLPNFELVKTLATEGFMTNTGRFVSREEASDIADQAGQLEHLEDDVRDAARHHLDSHDLEGLKQLEEDFEV